MILPVNDTAGESGVAVTWKTRLWGLWCILWAAVMTVPYATGSVLAQLRNPTGAKFRWWAHRWGRTLLRGMGIRVAVEWRGRPDPARPHVYVVNHQNALDIPVMLAELAQPFGFVAKAELEGVPFLGAAIKHSPSVFVDRTNPRRMLASIREAGRQIREGNAVLVFPEGERTYRREMTTFQKGAFTLAVEAGVPLVPVAIVDGYRVLDERRRVARPGTIHVVVGEPISLEGVGRKDIPELMARTRATIEALMDRA